MNPLPIDPGLLMLDGNRLELLRDVVSGWIDGHPLAPLEEEIILVQSNAAAEWLKMSMASRAGICAAVRIELPGRFLWRAYRQVLGREPGIDQSVLERETLTWRLMRLLPTLLERPAFAPVARYLAGRGADQRLQLARRVADLFDQYQVYRTDWLLAWESGRTTLTDAAGAERAIPDDQRWQALLWRAIVAELDDTQLASSRAHVQRAFVAALAAQGTTFPSLPRRVVLFGASHVAPQMLEALVALSSRVQVVLAILNPCRYAWGDIIDGRELLRQSTASVGATRRRPAKNGQDLAAVPFEAMHLHAHPLLAAWGRQGRDFVQQLVAFDDAAIERRLDVPKIPLFDDGAGTTLLTAVQAAIRDLVPLAEHPHRIVAINDRSIVFHVAHGVQREVEILHDQLLAMFAASDADGPGVLRPRDVVVMVPDIETFAPSIRSVFGQYRRGDARFIPFDIADLKSRGSDPLLVGLEWLLRLPDQRVRLQDVRDLLDIPAVASRAGLASDALPALFDWLAGAGVRWGLDATHRASLGLGEAGEQNTWHFGLQRLLLGYASGSGEGFAGIAPYDEVGGLGATALGAIAELVERLESWSRQATRDATPDEWAAAARGLLAAFFAPTDDRERLTMVALDDALASWLTSCATAAFDERVPLSVLREAWLSGIDGLDSSRRFMTGGVTFCTLLPLRAVPFEVVCLLGMNDGDFPRATRRSDFDLMGSAGLQRPGDRSRRDDDRYLMLEALLSARRTLYVSWCGFNPRDNTTQPPSVLVAQLRDYLAAGWRGASGDSLLADRTTDHPLQPFGRRYFEDGGPVTFAREWRAAHGPSAARKKHDAPGAAAPVPPSSPDPSPTAAAADAVTAVTLGDLAGFLANPVRLYFRARLGVRVAKDDDEVDDDEVFELTGLARYELLKDLLDDAIARLTTGHAPDRSTIEGLLARRVARIRASGSLPMFELGRRVVDEAAATAAAMIERWVAARAALPFDAGKRPVRFVGGDGLVLEDRIDDARSPSDRHDRPTRLVVTPSRLLEKGALRVDKLRAAWVAMLAAGASGAPATTIVIACDATVTWMPLDAARSAALLCDLMHAWSEGMTRALPFSSKTALAALDRPADLHGAAQAYEGDKNARGEREEFALNRLFPDFASLTHSGEFIRLAERLFEPMRAWARGGTIEGHPTSRASPASAASRRAATAGSLGGGGLDGVADGADPLDGGADR